MTELLLNPHTESQIKSFLTSPSHALILAGPTGIGKKSVSKLIASNLLSDFDQSSKDAYMKIISSEDRKQISIDAVRDLEHFLSLKVPSHNIVNRVVIIEDSHLLTSQAQNALLKTLEEPPAGTIIILTANQIQSLLTTIRSRAQYISIDRPSIESLQKYFSGKFNSSEITQALSMSGGLPGLTQALLNGENHPLKTATEMAKRILVHKTYERLVLVDELVKQKELCVNTFIILEQMAHLSLLTAVDEQADRWRLILEASYRALANLQLNCQAKLVVSDFILSI